MIDVGIICKNIEQVKNIAGYISDYTHQRPIFQRKEIIAFYFPLLIIDIMTISQVRGRKFHLTFYEKNISEEEICEIIAPCSPYARPRPLEDILWEVKNENLSCGSM